MLDNINNSSYPTRTEFNNSFIIYFYLYQTQNKCMPCKQEPKQVFRYFLDGEASFLVATLQKSLCLLL